MVVTVVRSGGDVVASIVDRLADIGFGAVIGGDFDGTGFVVGVDSSDAVNTLARVRDTLLTPSGGHTLNREFVLFQSSQIVDVRV